VLKEQLHGKNAIVTGAASGIGAATALRLAQYGMNVVLADIKPEPLNEYARQLRTKGLSVAAIATDVSDEKSIVAMADFAEEEFGNIHLAFNNAGVAMHGTPMHQMPMQDWQWVIDVNIRSIAYSIHHLLPRMLRHGQPGYFINTASIGGLQVNPKWLTGAYSMTKYAVVAMSEGLAQENKDSDIRVMVLCPSAVATGLGDSASRPNRFGGATERPEQAFLAEAIKQHGVSPDLVAQRILQAMENPEEFFIFTDSTARPVIEARHQRIQQAFDRTEAFLQQVR
jgi:NAD(P)-dependent dehydrogenase (short-subunit alcohol dehydrogenase family)